MTWLSLIAARVGIKGGIIAALCIVMAVMWWRADTISEQRDQARATIAEIKAAQIVAERAAIEAKAKAEADYRNLAERVDHEADKARDDALGAAELFIRNNRVRCPATRDPTGGPAAPAKDYGARDGQGPGAAPIVDAARVAVLAEDVRICTVNTLQAEAARAWSLELEQRD